MCRDGTVGASAGSVTIAITGGDSGWAITAALYTGVVQTGQNDFGTDTVADAGGDTISVTNIDVSAGGMVALVASCGTNSSTWGSWTYPLDEKADFGTATSSLQMGFGTDTESSAQSNKTYEVVSTDAGLRKTGKQTPAGNVKLPFGSPVPTRKWFQFEYLQQA